MTGDIDWPYLEQMHLSHYRFFGVVEDESGRLSRFPKGVGRIRSYR